jgi:hypothetical protein
MKRQKSELQCRDRYGIADQFENIPFTVSKRTQVNIMKAFFLIAFVTVVYYSVTH